MKVSVAGLGDFQENARSPDRPFQLKSWSQGKHPKSMFYLSAKVSPAPSQDSLNSQSENLSLSETSSQPEVSTMVTGADWCMQLLVTSLVALATVQNAFLCQIKTD